MRRCRVSAVLASSIGSTNRCFLLKDNPSNTRLASVSRLSAAARSGGTIDLPRFGIELDVDIDGVAAGDAGPFADLRAHAEHEPATHRRDAAPVRVAVDRDADLRSLAGSEARDDLVRDLDAGGTAVLLDRGAELHTTSHHIGSPEKLILNPSATVDSIHDAVGHRRRRPDAHREVPWLAGRVHRHGARGRSRSAQRSNAPASPPSRSST